MDARALCAVLLDPHDQAQYALGSALALALGQAGAAPLQAALPKVAPHGRAPGGVYALYYTNRAHPLYGGCLRDVPLYIGKAMAPCHAESQRVQRVTRHPVAARLADHRKSIEQARNLDVADFVYKHLDVNYAWIEGVETVLIQHHQPLWNTVLRGFGNHAPGRGRTGQKRSEWDTLHPGRPWAAQLACDVPSAVHVDNVRRVCAQRGLAPCISWTSNPLVYSTSKSSSSSSSSPSAPSSPVSSAPSPASSPSSDAHSASASPSESSAASMSSAHGAGAACDTAASSLSSSVSLRMPTGFGGC